MTDDGDSRRTITAVARAVDVLRLFGDGNHPDLGVTEIANALGFSKAVVHRILTTLATRDLVLLDHDTRRYRLGPATLALGMAYLDHIDLRPLAVPKLRALSAQTSETATLSLRYGDRRLYVEQVTPPREVRMSVPLGVPFPLHAGSSSKAFLAFLSPDEQQRYLDENSLDALTSETITQRKRLLTELSRILERGYAVSFGERQAGAGSVAAPVLDHHGEPAAVISVCGPLERFGDEVDMAAEHLLAATGDLSRRLGHLPSEMDPAR